MEFDIQKFMQNSDQHEFEFQNYPTSYLRCAAHRVAQHYGLQTSSLDNTLDGSGGKIIAIKNHDSKFPAVCLAQVPTKQTEKDLTEQVKIAIRPRASKSPFADATELQNRKSSVKTVEERKEEYEKARARIFNSYTVPSVEGSSSVATADRRSFYISGDEVEYFISTCNEKEKIPTSDGSSRVAILRDMEKDLSDPDYDRSYNRYPDEDAGEIPMAFVVRQSGSKLSEGEVMDFVAKQVAPYKKIRRVAFVSSIPKSPAGKILRRELINQLRCSKSTSKL